MRNRYALGDIDQAHKRAGSIPVSGTKTAKSKTTGNKPAVNSCFDINP
jgi:hypothetical protein